MKITPLTLGSFATNCYILQGKDPHKCVIIDPADHGSAILKVLQSLQTEPETVFLTHGHYDHILAVPDLQTCWPSLPVYCHPLDCPTETTEVDGGVVYPTVTAFSNLRPYGEGDEIPAIGQRFRILHTPGHTPGSVCLSVGDLLFTGDTLFQGDIGRTDFPGGDDGAMLHSLARPDALPGDYQILPGHDETSRLSRERRENSFLHRAREQVTL